MLSMIVVAIVIIPIAVRVPAVSFYVPPAMTVLPAILPRFRQFMPCMLGLFALPSMLLSGFVQTMIRFGDSFPAIIGPGAGRRQKQRQTPGEQSSAENHLPSYQISSVSHPSSLQVSQVCTATKS